jgi:hypothetical protein
VQTRADSSPDVPAVDSVYAPPSASFQEYNQDDPIIQMSAADNGYTLPGALIFPLTTPPQSLEDTSLPLESSEDIDDSNIRRHRRTRRTRSRAADHVEGPREADHNSKSRKTRRKH